ncbi:MAG TPA: tetratricopeptide repeat protein, partial [Thermoanaerobaculia bacterium]
MTDWLSASAMLLAGVIVGFMFLYGMKRRQERSDLERADLEAKRDAFVAKLREGPTGEERARLEAEAAAVLRKLDALGELPPPPAGATSSNAAVKGFAWGAGSVAVLAGIGWFVVQSAKPKEAPAVSSMAAADRSLSDLERSVQQNPDNLALRDDLAKAYLDRENLNGVAEQTQYVLQRNPNDARALTYQALVHIAGRQPEAAAAMLQRATQSDPNLIDAWVGLAWLNAQSGDLKRAEAAIDEAKRRHPEESARLDQLMAHLRPETPLQITLNLANGVAVPQQGVIFIIVRAAGVKSGPPAAVKRLAISTFPMTVNLSSADSMMGQPLPAKMRIEARIDAD